LNDASTDFSTALHDTNEESLDDLAHFRPNRHGTIRLDCFGPRGYHREDPAEHPPIEVRTFPEEDCPPYCTDCRRAFVVGEIFHPEPDGTRCIECFKVNYRARAINLARIFRASMGPGTGTSAPMLEGLRATLAAAFPSVPVEINESDATKAVRDAVASLGEPLPWTPEREREYIEACREIKREMEKVIADAPRGESAAEIALAELTKGIEENAVGRCSKCGKATANPAQIGAQCVLGSGSFDDPCRGFIRNLVGTFERPVEAE
jgi:hypothetical protein